MILARLAVDKTKHGHGLGKALLKDVLIRAVSGAELAGLRALVVHAKNASAKTFYENFDFEAFPNNPLHLYKLLSEIKKELRK